MTEPPTGAAEPFWRSTADAVGLAWRAAPVKATAQVLLAVLVGTVPVGVGLLTKLVVDRVAGAPSGGATGLVPLAIALAAAGVAAGTLPHLAGYLERDWGRAVALRAQSDLYAAVNRLVGLVRLENPEFRDRLRMAEEAGRNSPTSVVSSGLDILRGSVTVAGFLGTLLVLNPWMVLVVACAAVPAAWGEFNLARQRADSMWRLSPAARRQFFYTDLLTGLDAAKEIRLFGLADLFGARMLRELRTIDAESRRLDRRELAVQGTLAVVSAVAGGVGLVWAVFAAGTGRLSVGDIALFIAAVAGTQLALASSIGRLAQAHQALTLFEHYRELLRAGSDLPLPAAPRPVPALRSGIRLRDVWFRYGVDQPWILRGLDLHVPYGRSVALVGLNGAGKSSVVKLLLRFYDPERGSVEWDGADLRSLSIVDLRSRVGAVFQDFMCYDLSAGENVGLGDLTALDDEARQVGAARHAGAHDTLAALPRGYATQLTRMFVDRAADGDASGVLLSGGQWQRVALARSLLRADRDLLILDEPSAGLDAEAEHDIHLRLRDLRAGRTTVLISHRLSAVREADRIAVIGGGRVVEEGTHDELVAAGGEYARLFRLQAAGYRETVA